MTTQATGYAPGGSGVGFPGGVVPPMPASPVPKQAAQAAPTQSDFDWIRDQFEAKFDRWVTERITGFLYVDPFTSFVLMACATDCLAGFYAGGEAGGPDFIKFVDTFYPKHSDGSTKYVGSAECVKGLWTPVGRV